MKKIDTARFESLVSQSERINAIEGFTRFYPIKSTEIIGSAGKRTRILVFGMYDYKNKNFVLSKPFVDVNKSFDEIEYMLKTA